MYFKIITAQIYTPESRIKKNELIFKTSFIYEKYKFVL